MSIFKSNYIDLSDFLALATAVQKQTMANFDQNSQVSFKADHSPVTAADLSNHELLSRDLRRLRKIPVFSEEDYPSYDERRTHSEYWLIDPLDGTKEFVNRVPEFSVLVALIKNNRPAFSAILIPALNSLYLAELGLGAFVNENGEWRRISMPQTSSAVGLISRFHPEPEVEEFYKMNSIPERAALGSALKFCAIAEGQAAVYFRHKGPHEWDVAAGDLLVQESGGTIFCWPEKQSLKYNSEGTRVRPFVAANNTFLHLREEFK